MFLLVVVYVGLRSQSLADPTLSYGALTGRRAVFWWNAAVRTVPASPQMRLLEGYFVFGRSRFFFRLARSRSPKPPGFGAGEVRCKSGWRLGD